MDAFVEHVDAEQQLEMIAVVLFEGVELSAGCGIVRIRRVDVGFGINLGEPLPCQRSHLTKMLVVGTEHDIFAVTVGDML